MVQHDSDELSIEINVDGSHKMGAMPAMVCRHASRQAFRKGDLLSLHGSSALSPIAKTNPGAHSSTRCSGSHGPSRSSRWSRYSRSRLPADFCPACLSPCQSSSLCPLIPSGVLPSPCRMGPDDLWCRGSAQTAHDEAVRVECLSSQHVVGEPPGHRQSPRSRDELGGISCSSDSWNPSGEESGLSHGRDSCFPSSSNHSMKAWQALQHEIWTAFPHGWIGIRYL